MRRKISLKLVLLLLAIILVGAIVFVWKVLEIGNNDQPVIKSSNNEQSKKNESVDLNIEELGVKIKLQEEVKDAVYSYKNSSDRSSIAYISTHSLTEKDKACSADKGPLGAIIKTDNSTHEVFGTKLEANGKTIFKFDEHFFILQFPNAPCSLDDAVEVLASKQRKAFAESFKTIRPY